jgi:hypothetical protein
MVHSAGLKWSKFLVIVYLILATTGTLAISPEEAYSFVKSSKDSLGSSSFFSTSGHVVDWFAEDTTTISKAQRYSLFRLRNVLLRLFTSIGVISAGIFLTNSRFKKIKKEYIPILENLVPLKLRI